MDIIVCVKQVPDPENAKMDFETGRVLREGVKNIINPFDLYAIEESLRIKEKMGGTVTVISMGPPQAEEALREAIAMGADRAFLISSRAFAGADTLATSYTLSMGIKYIGKFDLIICGKQAIDGDTAQVGPGIAAHLNIPEITFVRKIDEITDSYIVAERLVEGGYEILKAPLPCLISVVKEINIPRLPSLKGKINAKKAVIPILTEKELNVDENRIGEKGSPTQVVKVFSPELKKEGIIFENEIEKGVDKVIEVLEKMGII
uniref:Electron transfer flavoprotein subunit beta/FixA family protein n=1 Tax=candidate division WOR-3 bacterium TaxID=2052148 RepID=A0A7C4YF30_UNCW3